MKQNPAHDGALKFLRTEVATATTLVSLAETAFHPEKISRNWKNAKKAVAAIRHFLGRADLTGAESEEIHKDVEGLERRLKDLEPIADQP
jgi:hypothetical protein